MLEHVIEDAVWQRMMAALDSVPYMQRHDLDRLRRFVCACFVVMRNNLTWAELAGLVSSAEAAQKRFRRWAKKGVWDRLMACSQPVAALDVLHVERRRSPDIDSTSVKCHRTATGARGGGAESIGCSRGGLTSKVHHASQLAAQNRGDGLGFIRRQLTSPGRQADGTHAEALTAGLQPLPVVGDLQAVSRPVPPGDRFAMGYDSDKLRDHWRRRGIGTCVPPKRSRVVQHWYDMDLYRTRHLVENSFNPHFCAAKRAGLKDLRRLSLRLDKTETSFGGFLASGAAILNGRLEVRLCV